MLPFWCDFQKYTNVDEDTNQTIFLCTIGIPCQKKVLELWDPASLNFCVLKRKTQKSLRKQRLKAFEEMVIFLQTTEFVDSQESKARVQIKET